MMAVKLSLAPPSTTKRSQTWASTHPPVSLGTWNVNATGNTINVVFIAPEPVPGPLPLFGSAADYGWSRRLRRRISTAKTTRPG